MGLVLNPRASVAVIGAGLAGLTAARRLHLAGHDVVVYEARDHVGGRTRTITEGFADGQHANLGAELITRGYREFQRLSAEIGIELSEPVSYERSSGETALERYLEPGRLIIGDGLLTGTDFQEVADELRLAIEATPAGPHEVLGQWVRRARLSAAARGAVKGATRMLTQADLRQIDGQRYLFPNVTMEGARRVVGGTGRLAERLAEDVSVRLDTPVRSVRQGGGVFITTERGDTERFDHLIATPPFHVLATIGFQPMLEPQRLAALNAFEAAIGGKVVAQYAEGDAVRKALTRCCLTDGPFNTILVSNPYVTEGPAVVAASACGSDRVLLERPEEALDLLDELVTLVVGAPVTRIAGTTKDWTADRWALAAAATVGEAQRSELVARVARPLGRIHFAGDYTDLAWGGTLEGALRSGQRAADEVLRRPIRIPLAEIEARLVRR